MFCPVEMSIHRYCDDDNRREDAINARLKVMEADSNAVSESLDLRDPQLIAEWMTAARKSPADLDALSQALLDKLWAMVEVPLKRAAEQDLEDCRYVV